MFKNITKTRTKTIENCVQKFLYLVISEFHKNNSFLEISLGIISVLIFNSPEDVVAAIPIGEINLGEVNNVRRVAIFVISVRHHAQNRFELVILNARIRDL